MLVFLSYITVAASDVDAYIDTCHSIVHPIMQEQTGYGGLALLRPRTGSETVRLVLVDWWTRTEDHELWVNSPAHGAIQSQTSHFVISAESSAYEYADDLSLAIGDPATASMFSIGFQQVAAGQSTEDVVARRAIASNSMREAPGIVGISVCKALGGPARFMTLLEWTDDATADEYYASGKHADMVVPVIADVLTKYYTSAEHADVVIPVIADVVTMLEPGERYDILIRDASGSGRHSTN